MAEMIDDIISSGKLKDYSKHFSESEFWDVIKKYAKHLGSEGLHHALTLYYALWEPDTPAWAKTVIAGALGYLILPLDAIPDVIPVVGLTDDIGIIAAAIAAIEMNIPQAAVDKADEKMSKWFGKTTEK